MLNWTKQKNTLDGKYTTRITTTLSLSTGIGLPVFPSNSLFLMCCAGSPGPALLLTAHHLLFAHSRAAPGLSAIRGCHWEPNETTLQSHNRTYSCDCPSPPLTEARKTKKYHSCSIGVQITCFLLELPAEGAPPGKVIQCCQRDDTTWAYCKHRSPPYIF